jgi:hypothetical protein
MRTTHPVWCGKYGLYVTGITLKSTRGGKGVGERVAKVGSEFRLILRIAEERVFEGGAFGED